MTGREVCVLSKMQQLFEAPSRCLYFAAWSESFCCIIVTVLNLLIANYQDVCTFSVVRVYRLLRNGANAKAKEIIKATQLKHEVKSCKCCNLHVIKSA